MEKIYIDVNIKRIRRWMNMGLVPFAQKLGLSQNTIASYEAGRQTPNLHTLVLLSEISGFSLDELVFTKVAGGLRT